MPDEQLIFKPVVEALFVHGLRDKMTPTFRKHLETKGLKLDHLLPGYAYALWQDLIVDAVQLFPELHRSEALAELGRRLSQSSIDRSPGASTLLPLLRLLGTTKGLKRALKANSGENFNKVSFTNESPRSVDVTMSFVGTIPEFARGTMFPLMSALGAKNGRCSILAYEAPQATYRLEWDS